MNSRSSHPSHPVAVVLAAVAKSAARGSSPTDRDLAEVRRDRAQARSELLRVAREIARSEHQSSGLPSDSAASATLPDDRLANYHAALQLAATIVMYFEAEIAEEL